MISFDILTLFFEGPGAIYLVQAEKQLKSWEIERLSWLLNAKLREPKKSGATELRGPFIGPRPEMVTPWSTNATAIATNSGISGITRIEYFVPATSEIELDPMLQSRYEVVTEQSLVIERAPEKTFAVTNLEDFNKKEGLSLSTQEISYLRAGSEKLGRPLTDCEVYGFSQINSEHCRHKIFNGRFVIDGKEKPSSLFSLIKETSKASPHNIVSAYEDSVAFVRGPTILQFAPESATRPSFYQFRTTPSVIALKAETHNFPTTVEPFNGASTGSGGEIRDRMAGGRGALPLAGNAVYFTSSPRLETSPRKLPRKRHWKYQTPLEILIKASNGASDFGNKFGQPLIVGSILTFEMETSRSLYAYDRCVMLAGGVGYGHAEQAKKFAPERGDKVVVLGGDNYRIGMGGGSVSSADSGAHARSLELSAIQRANPEMQKRTYNVIRALTEQDSNPIRLIHDHGAGGHINCLTELLSPIGGRITIEQLPLGDPTLSVREILCNESQERMGLIIHPDALPLLESACVRERSPLYVVGEISGDKKIVFEQHGGESPVNLPVDLLLGSSPTTVLEDQTTALQTEAISFKPSSASEFLHVLQQVLSLENVACKDWLTNKVDRCVTGRIALQQCTGPLQLPLNNLGIVTLDYQGQLGIASGIGHAPAAGLIDPEAGSVLSVAEALTNIIWAPLEAGVSSVALSANWMWPAKRPGEDVRLYRAVEAISRFAIELGIPIPTGKDSLSMTVFYDDGLEVRAPGTVIVSAVAPVSQVRLAVTPVLKNVSDSVLLYLNISGVTEHRLGGSAYAQIQGLIGSTVPSVSSATIFRTCFEIIQSLLNSERILAGHDISSGGVISALCEMAFAGELGLSLTINDEPDIGGFLFGEKPGLLLQVQAKDKQDIVAQFRAAGLEVRELGKPTLEKTLHLECQQFSVKSSMTELLRTWFKPSYLFDLHQTKAPQAKERFDTVETRRLNFKFPGQFSGKAADYGVVHSRSSKTGLVAAVIREQGTNGEREMAFSLHAAGFDVKDVTMSDLALGHETLADVRLIAFPGGFANSDVLGASRGWGGAFRYNDKAYQALKQFYSRKDTLSLGACNGCQLFAVLNLLGHEPGKEISMLQNASGKFESSFLAVQVSENTNSVFLRHLRGSTIGVWVAHGEGQFHFPGSKSDYDIACQYVASSYPENPNGSPWNTAAVSSNDGRHLMIMPHPERSTLPWQWGYYPEETRKLHDISPWMLLFTSARDWLRST